MHRGVLHSASIELHIAVTLEIVLFRLLQSQEQYVVKQLSILNFKRGGPPGFLFWQNCQNALKEFAALR